MRYEYICSETGEEKVVYHGMNESPVVKSISGNKMVKKIFATTIHGMDNLGRSKK